MATTTKTRKTTARKTTAAKTAKADKPEKPSKGTSKVGSIVDIEIPALQLETIKITLVGQSPLIMHKFSEKSKKMIADKQQGKAKDKRKAKDPKAEFEAAIYYLGGKKKNARKHRYGFPASAFKQCAVSAARYVDGVKMTYLKGAFHILGSDVDPSLVEILVKKAPQMREDTVRIGGFGAKVADLRYRPEFIDWKAELRIQYNVAAITPQQIAHLLNVGGFSIGVGDWRPEKEGVFGRFNVA